MKRSENTSADPATLTAFRPASPEGTHTTATSAERPSDAGNRTRRKEHLRTAATACPISLTFVAFAIWLLNSVATGSIFLLIVVVLFIAWGAGGLIFTVNQLLTAYDAKD